MGSIGRFVLEEETASGSTRTMTHHGKDGYDFHYVVRLVDTPMPVRSVSLTRGPEGVTIEYAGVLNDAEGEGFFARYADRW